MNFGFLFLFIVTLNVLTMINIQNIIKILVYKIFEDVYVVMYCLIHVYFKKGKSPGGSMSWVVGLPSNS